MNAIDIAAAATITAALVVALAAGIVDERQKQKRGIRKTRWTKRAHRRRMR